MLSLPFDVLLCCHCRRTRKDEDYAKYKEALNAATTEIRQSKRSYEQKLACNIKNDSKSFYAYVRSKQNVQDKVGPLEDSAGNIISQGFLMVEDLNGYSVVFTILVHYQLLMLNFRGLNVLGPLVVTPELVAKKIKAMKDLMSCYVVIANFDVLLCCHCRLMFVNY